MAAASTIDHSSRASPDELKVMEILRRDGRVIVCAAPGSTKDSLLSFLRHEYRKHGWMVYDLKGVKKCHGEDLPDNTRCLLLINSALGEARLDMSQYDTFYGTNTYSISHPVTHHIVFLLYPNILYEFLRSNRITKPHVEHVVEVVSMEVDSLVSDYLDFFLTVLGSPAHGHIVGPLLALTMLDHSCQVGGKEEIEAQAEHLGFDRVRQFKLREYSQVLVGFILADSKREFMTRDVYDAAGLAIAEFYSDMLALQVCDVRFLVQHVHIHAGSEYNWARGTENSSASGSEHRKVAATENDSAAKVTESSRSTGSEHRTATGTPLVLNHVDSVLLLMKRMLGAVVTGQLPEICQHPCLHSSEFLQEFEEFCKKNELHDVINAVDPQHGLPLLYWSVWSLSCEFSEWCLRLVMSQHKGDTASEVLLSTALLAALVTNTTDVDMSQFVKKVCDNLSPLKEVTSMKEIVLPFPSKQKRYTEKLHQICSDLMNCSLCYLGTVPLDTLQQLLIVKLTDMSINFKREGCLLYLLLRLLTESQVDEEDREGNTLLHMAADVGQVQMVQMLLQCGASVLTRNKAGLTPPQLAATRRHQRQGRSRVSDTRSWKCFQAACHKGDMDTVKSLLCHDTTVCDRGTGGVTGLHLASQSGRTHVASLLIDLGAEVNAVNSSQQTPLHLACMGRQLEIVALLVERGADVVTQDSTGQTALHVACERGEVEMATLLLQHNAVIHTHNKAGHTPFVVACLQGHWNLAELLLSHLSDINGLVCGGGVDTLLHLACRDGCAQLAQFLLQRGASADVKNKYGLTALHLACLAGHIDIVRLLIKHRADLDMRINEGISPLVMVHVTRRKGSWHTFLFDSVDVDAHCEGGCAALQEAGQAEDTERLRTLLHHMSTVSTSSGCGRTLDTAGGNGQTKTLHELLQYNDSKIVVYIPKCLSSLHIAAIKGQTQIAKLLMLHGAAVNMCDSSGLAPLHLACICGRTAVNIIKLLLKHHADVNNSTSGGGTPLHFACANGHTAIVRLMLQHNADVNISTLAGMTPLHLACTHGKSAIVKLLLQYQADVVILASNGRTPLHWACISGQTAIVKLLMQHNADVNISASGGVTPLILACFSGHTDVAIHLLQSGADATMETDDGDTALDTALRRGHNEIVRLLRQHSSHSHSVIVDQQLTSPTAVA